VRIMRKLGFQWAVALACGACLMASASSTLAAPKGAKAIFDSGSGGTIGMSATAARPTTTAATAMIESAPVADRYVGISYQILAIENDGQMRAVTKNRVFRSGDRVKILARTNRPGYLTVANIGTSGRMNVLFSEYVDANRMTEIPPNSNLRFDNNPGTENILITLSNEPSPFAPARSGNQMVAAPPPAPAAPAYPAQAAAPAYPAPDAAPAYPAPPSASYTPPPAMPTAYPAQGAAPYPPPMPMADAQMPVMPGAGAPPIYPPMPPGEASANLVASLEGAKSLKAKGAKDLMIEDNMESSYAVVSSRQGFKTVSGGAKDLLVESSADGVNYGVLPVSAISGGGILTLEIKLKHR
jgi:hypothetical protein